MTLKKNKSLTLDEITNTLKEKMPELKEEYKIKSLGLFGSFLRETDTKNSDLDILVEFEETPTLLMLARLQNLLSDIVGIKVDLVLKKTLKPHISKHILHEVVYI